MSKPLLIDYRFYVRQTKASNTSLYAGMLDGDVSAVNRALMLLASCQPEGTVRVVRLDSPVEQSTIASLRR
jgi:hypothetical protein